MNEREFDRQLLKVYMKNQVRGSNLLAWLVLKYSDTFRGFTRFVKDIKRPMIILKRCLKKQLQTKL